MASGDADLSIASPTNHVTGTFAAANSASGAILKFKSDSGFTIGTLAAAGTFAGASGVTTNNGDINIDAGGDVTLNVVNAGTANVTLSSSGMNGLRSASPNDGTADVVGNQISLTVTGPSSGNAGQIGFFTTSAQFFEVNGNILNASTNNSRLWIRDIGSGPTAGIAVGSVNAGTNTAFLQVASGDLKSQTVDGNADVVAAAVNLRANNGGNVGIFGGTPLEVNATNLNAAVLVAAGTINILDTAATMNVVRVGPDGERQYRAQGQQH